MFDVLGWTKTRLLGTDVGTQGYECANCGARMARQPFTCPECGCYRVDWIGWQHDRELLE